MSEALQNICTWLPEIEMARDSKVLVFGVTHLDIDILPTLYDVLSEMQPIKRLDVVVHCRGGDITAARRIAGLLEENCEQLGFIVPFYCQSAGTIMTLAADEIITGSAAVFSPIDPQLQGASDATGGGQPAISAEDIRCFKDLCLDWFNAEQNDAGDLALASLTSSIFPTTLTSFYRAVQETKTICTDLLSLRDNRFDEAMKKAIVDRLLFGFFSHGYPISGQEMRALGLPVRSDSDVENISWKISAIIRKIIGAGMRHSPEDDWTDTLLATDSKVWMRRKTKTFLSPVWSEVSLTS